MRCESAFNFTGNILEGLTDEVFTEDNESQVAHFQTHRTFPEPDEVVVILS